jgi:hypothetical protein
MRGKSVEGKTFGIEDLIKATINYLKIGVWHFGSLLLICLYARPRSSTKKIRGIVKNMAEHAF